MQTPNEWAATDSVPFGSPRRVQPVRSSRFSRCNSISVESIGTRVYQDETGSCGAWSRSAPRCHTSSYRGLWIETSALTNSVQLPATTMLTTTGYFRDFRVFGILAVLAAIFAVLCSSAITNAMRALFILCHITHPLSRSSSRSIISASQRNTETIMVDAAVGAESAACVAANASRQFATASPRNECARRDCRSQTIHQPQQRRL